MPLHSPWWAPISPQCGAGDRTGSTMPPHNQCDVPVSPQCGVDNTASVAIPLHKSLVHADQSAIRSTETNTGGRALRKVAQNAPPKVAHHPCRNSWWRPTCPQRRGCLSAIWLAGEGIIGAHTPVRNAARFSCSQIHSTGSTSCQKYAVRCPPANTNVGTSAGRALILSCFESVIFGGDSSCSGSVFQPEA